MESQFSLPWFFERVLEKRVPELHQEIRDFTKSDLSKLPITRFATTRGNYFWNRLVLRTIHMMVNRFPRLYATKGGGISVTSLIARNLPGLFSGEALWGRLPSPLR